MFLIKLISHTRKGEVVEVHRSEMYRYEPDYKVRGGILLQFEPVRGRGTTENYLLLCNSEHFSEAFIMNEDGKTIEIIRAPNTDVE